MFFSLTDRAREDLKQLKSRIEDTGLDTNTYPFTTGK